MQYYEMSILFYGKFYGHLPWNVHVGQLVDF